MSHQIDPDVMYRIRSRGAERPAMEGHRLPQLVRDFVLARHDELSEDGQHWFTAGEVESLFPSTSSAHVIRERLIRERLSQEPTEYTEQSSPQVVDDRKFPREPWYLARASNVAGPYDQVTIAMWYEEGCLRDDDQLRPGPHANWRPLRKAQIEGLLEPPPANSCSINPIHLVAERPVWMGPAATTDSQIPARTPTTEKASKTATTLAWVLATVGVIAVFTSLLCVAWLLVYRQRREVAPARTADQPTNRTRSVGGDSIFTD